jgi:3-dehydroquinate synthase
VKPPAPPERIYTQAFAVSFAYPVYFTRDVLSPDNVDLRDAIASREPGRRHRVLAIVDAGVVAAWPSLCADLAAYAQRHADRICLAAEPIIVPGGEASKNDPAIVAALHARFEELAMDRHSFVLLIGGGAVLDMGGYAAATAHRGLRVVRVPTTTLGQDDSGVGVKNGVNAFGKKNFLGTFAPPYAVLNDVGFLRTLDRRDRVAGMAEAVKVALIRDASFFDWLREHAAALAGGAPEMLEILVRRAAELHLAHIASGGDPFELGSARPLDFGHWAAHKLESMTAHRLRHGEAVAIGIALDALYSAETGRCDATFAREVVSVLDRLGLPTYDAALDVVSDAGRPVVLDGLAEFREHLGGELTLTLLAGAGRGVEVHEIDEPRMIACIAALRALAKRR